MPISRTPVRAAPPRLVTDVQQIATFNRRMLLLGGAQGLTALGLGARMGWLTIKENDRYNRQSESNRVSTALVLPQRGWIVDRHGAPLASNRPSFRIDMIPDLIEDRKRVLDLLRRLLGLGTDAVSRIVADLNAATGFQPVVIKDGVTWEQFAAINVRLPELPGVVATRGFARNYPAGAAVAHLTGYVGAANADQYRQTHDRLLVTPGFQVGKDGLEKVLEPQLRGMPGTRRMEATAHGRLLRALPTVAGVPGETQRLTIDAGLQEYAARRLGTDSGSAVVMDCRTGEILAMASMPAYDPNHFSQGIRQLEWEMLRKDDHLPLLNKVTQGLYPPGSTVKPMNGLALLGAGIDPHERVVCTGAMRVGTGLFHCYKRAGHGAVDLKRAIMQSCDIYFYEMARRLGYERIAPVARMMGLGDTFALPLVSQRYGTVPDGTWKRQKYKADWTIADTLNASIGQGYMLVNPLQLAVMAARIASGRRIEPSLLANHVHREPTPLALAPEHLDLVRNAMAAVVNEGGTGGAARMQVPGVQLAAKTGTSQVRRITMAERAGGVLKNISLPFRLRDHALFVCFAPAVDPRYAAAIVLEHGGHTDHDLDTPAIGRDIMTYLFDRKQAIARLAMLEPLWSGRSAL